MQKLLAPIFICLLATTGTGVARSSAPEFNWTGRVSSGDEVEVRNLNGSVSLVSAPGDSLSVNAVRTADRSDPNSVHVVVNRDRGGVTVCAVYPGEEDSDCTRGRGAHHHRNRSTENNDVSVAFKIAVPAGTAAIIQTVNGSVEGRGLSCPVDATAVNGHVTISTSSYARAHTVNGAIDVSMGDPNWPDDVLSFSSVNGAIDVTVPSATSARIHFKTMHGSIQSDFGIGRHDGPFGIMQYAAGTIGGGKRSIELTTINGSIRLAKGP